MKTKKKTKAKAPRFWVIDTDTMGSLSAFGPYRTQKEAEAAIVADIRSLWEESCTCLTSEKTTRWCKPLHIVEVRRTVEPDITPTIRLVDVGNDQIQPRHD